MWFVLAPMVAAAILGQAASEEERNRLRQLLGLASYPIKSMDQHTSLADWAVPIVLWPDGGIWRIISGNAVEELSSHMEGWNKADDVVNSLSLEDWKEEEIRTMSGGLFDVYVYVEEVPHPREEDKPWIVPHPQEKAPKILQVMVTETNERTQQIRAAWFFPESIRNVTGRTSLARERLRMFSEEMDLDPDDEEATRIEDVIVPAVFLEAHLEMKTALNSGGDTDAVIAKWSARNSKIGTWAEAYRNVWWAVGNQNNQASEMDEWAGYDEEEIYDHLVAEGDEDTIRRLEEAMKKGDTGVIERTRESKMRDLLEWQRESNIPETTKAFKAEADALENLLVNFKLRPPSSRYNQDEDRLATFVLNPIGVKDIENDYDRVNVTIDTDNGAVSIYLSEGFNRFSDDSPGITDAIRSYFETVESVAEKAGDVIFRFPGTLTGMWEVWSLLGSYKPTGRESWFLFLKIAFDHGLLSEAARSHFAFVLETWADPTAMMMEDGLLK